MNLALFPQKIFLAVLTVRVTDPQAKQSMLSKTPIIINLFLETASRAPVHRSPVVRKNPIKEPPQVGI